MKIYNTSAEYEPIPFGAACPEGSTRLDFLSYTYFWRRWSDKFPKIIFKSKSLDFYDTCYIFCNYYKSLNKQSYENSDVFINYDDDGDYYDDDYDDDYDAVDGDVNDPDVITNVKFEVHNTQYTKVKRRVLSSHLQIIQAYYLKKRLKII